MSSGIHMELEGVITAMFQSLVKDKAEVRKNSALAVSIRVQFNYWGGRQDRSVCRLFKVIYFSPNNYTKVMWRNTEFTDFEWEGEYTLIGDHDSCWRDNWEELTRARRALRNELTLSLSKAAQSRLAKGTERLSEFTVIDKVELIPITYEGGVSYERKPVIVGNGRGGVPFQLTYKQAERAA
jgi:hypothetical protein